MPECDKYLSLLLIKFNLIKFVKIVLNTKTTISIERETKDKLNQIGRKGLTYDQIINKVLGEKD